MTALVNLFNSLQDNQNSQVKDIEQQLEKLLGSVSVETQQEILKDETTLNAIKELLEKWNRESAPQNEEDVF